MTDILKNAPTHSEMHDIGQSLHPIGLYDPSEDHSSCGVGMVAAIDGQSSRSVVTAAIEALKAIWHRGAVDADGTTGDGAGIHLEIPQQFFHEHVRATGHEPIEGKMTVGMVFLPRTDLALQEQCREIVESVIMNFGFTIYGCAASAC